MNPNLLAQLMYLAGLGRVYVGNEADWLIKLIQDNPNDVGATLGAVVNSPEGKAWAAKLVTLRNGQSVDLSPLTNRVTTLEEAPVKFHKHNISVTETTNYTGTTTDIV